MKKLIFCLLLSLGSSPLISQSYCKHIKTFRQSAKETFATMDDSPLERSDIGDMHFYRAKKKYKVAAKLSVVENAKPFEMATYSGMIKPYKIFGVLKFNLGGKEMSLEAYQNLNQIRINPNHLFIPFKDETNGQSTYGGGRYINLSKSNIEDGVIYLDFNKAYNPWCAYSDGYNCPIPPQENHLSIEIKAGEKNYTGKRNQRKQ